MRTDRSTASQCHQRIAACGSAKLDCAAKGEGVDQKPSCCAKSGPLRSAPANAMRVVLLLAHVPSSDSGESLVQPKMVRSKSYKSRLGSASHGSGVIDDGKAVVDAGKSAALNVSVRTQRARSRRRAASHSPRHPAARLHAAPCDTQPPPVYSAYLAVPPES